MSSLRRQKLLTSAGVAATAVLLTAAVWWPLWNGGGFVGGDVYSYYFPQKVYFAESVRENRLPLWNNRVGHGYPFVAESQTGVFYPPNLLLYRLFDVNTAYNANHLLHYALAFVFAWMLGRSVGLGRIAAGLSAFVYVYGWFPARSCWEWAIIGGAWFPAVLWCCERFLSTRLWRWLIVLAVVLGVQLLAGHYNLAFITLVVLIVWVALRLTFASDRVASSPDVPRIRLGMGIVAAVVCACGLSAVQLLPTWELKQLSQRAAPGANHNLAHGSIPMWYWLQFIEPWRWYAVDFNRDASLDAAEAKLGAPTNQVEAHLYFGLVPLALALYEILHAALARNRERLCWGGIAVATLVYTSGVLIPIFQLLPGFSFFQGPGRWGVVTTLMVALLAGSALDRLRNSPTLPAGLWVVAATGVAMWSTLTLAAGKQQAASLAGIPNPLQIGPFEVSDALLSGLMMLVIVGAVIAALLTRLQTSSKNGSSRLQGSILTACILLATLFDLWLVSGLVKYSEIVSQPPINRLADSPLRKILTPYGGTARLLAPAANLPTVLGAGSTPPYLTFGPAAYVDPKLRMPEQSSPEQITWLQRAGVTHILSFEPLRAPLWPVVPVWQGFDPVMNPALARREPLYLYVLQGSRGRAAWADAASDGTIQVDEYAPDRIAISTNSPTGGRLVLTDLSYPGWTAAIDGEPVEMRTFDGWFRAVDVPAGAHTIIWSYRPAYLYWGAAAGVFTLLVLAAVAHVRFWHPQRWTFLDEAPKR